MTASVLKKVLPKTLRIRPPDQVPQVHPQKEGDRHPRPANSERLYCGDFADFELLGFSFLRSDRYFGDAASLC
jgi:hypothetical protein